LGIIVENKQKKMLAPFKKTLEKNNIPYDIIGETVKEKTITINKKINLNIKKVKKEWETSLRKKLLS
jgi:hypothetical protein